MPGNPLTWVWFISPHTLFTTYLVIIFGKSCCLANNDVITTYSSSWCNKSIIVQLIVHGITHAWKKCPHNIDFRDETPGLIYNAAFSCCRGMFNRPFPSCLKPLIQSETKYKAITWKWFFSLIQIKLIFTTKFLHFASFWKWEFLKLGNGLLSVMRCPKVCHLYALGKIKKNWEAHV